MSRWLRAKGRVVGVCVAGALVLAGCGSGTSKGGSAVVTVPGRTLAVYASQPPGPATPVTTDTLDAEQLALQQGQSKAGSFRVRLIPVHGHELSANARTAIENPNTIAYLGELVPGTSQVSTEILDQQGILEVSPADTAAYLTQVVPTVSSSVNSFYPGHSTYKQTFARVVPNSGLEAQALVRAMQAAHASSVYATGDQTLYGQTLAVQVAHAAKAAGLSAAGALSQAQAYFYGASTSSPNAQAAAIKAFDTAAAANPSVKLYAPSGLYGPGFVSGLSAAAQDRLFITSPGFLSRGLPATGKNFVRTFAARYGHTPAPQALFGYEAMSAVLADLAQAGSTANQRAAVATDFRSLKRSDSVLGPYSISGGDPSIAPFVLAHIRGGRLVPFASLATAG